MRRVMGYVGTVAGFRQILARFRREYGKLAEKVPPTKGGKQMEVRESATFHEEGGSGH